MRSFYIIALIVITAMIISLAWADQVMISTYYPAPFGVYRTMKVDVLHLDPVDSNTFNFDSKEDALVICDETDNTLKRWDSDAGGGAGDWAPLGGSLPTYDSGWFYVTGNNNYTLTHDLGSIALLTQILWTPDSGGAPDLSKVATVETTRWGAGALEMGAQIRDITTTTLKVCVSGSYLSDASYEGGYAYTPGHYRVFAIRLD